MQLSRHPSHSTDFESHGTSVGLLVLTVFGKKLELTVLTNMHTANSEASWMLWLTTRSRGYPV